MTKDSDAIEVPIGMVEAALDCLEFYPAARKHINRHIMKEILREALLYQQEVKRRAVALKRELERSGPLIGSFVEVDDTPISMRRCDGME